MCGFKNFDLRAGHVLRLTSCFEHGQREQETKKKVLLCLPPYSTLTLPLSPPQLLFSLHPSLPVTCSFHSIEKFLD